MPSDCGIAVGWKFPEGGVHDSPPRAGCATWLCDAQYRPLALAVMTMNRIGKLSILFALDRTICGLTQCGDDEAIRSYLATMAR